MKDVILVAFKILTQNEMDILNENERKIYEQEYKEYLERKAFVEKLERLESVKMPKVSVKKRNIKRVKALNISKISLQSYTVDNAHGKTLLNATNAVKKNLSSNAQFTVPEKYKVALPCISIASPNQLSVNTDTRYQIDNIPVVPLAKPSVTQYDEHIFKAEVLQLPAFIQATTKSVEIADYVISDCSNVIVTIPDTIAVIDSMADITLSVVPVVKLPIVNIDLTTYEISNCEKTVTIAPTVNYIEQKNQKVELCSVPVPEPGCFMENLRRHRTKIVVQMRSQIFRQIG
jgi:hypothetical protein